MRRKFIIEMVSSLVIVFVGSVIIIFINPDGWRNSIGSLILWITAIIVAIYTYETYRLRIASQEQTRFAQRAYRKDHTPIVIPDSNHNIVRVHKQTKTAQWGISNISGGNSALNIKIIGKKSGKIAFLIDGKTLDELPKLGETGVGMASSGIPILLNKLKIPLDQDVFEISYRDIFGNDWSTVGIRFLKLDNNSFAIDENHWSLK